MVAVPIGGLDGEVAQRLFAGQKLLGKRRPVVGQVLFVAEQDNPTAEVAAAQRLYGFSPGKSPPTMTNVVELAIIAAPSCCVRCRLTAYEPVAYLGQPVTCRRSSSSYATRTNAAASSALELGATDASFFGSVGKPSCFAAAVARSSKYGRTQIQTS